MMSTPSFVKRRGLPLKNNNSTPVPSNPSFGFLLIGGAVVGAQIRDVRLANELFQRGFPVHVWWAMDRPRNSGLDPAIPQNWLFSSARYGGVSPSYWLDDLAGRAVSRITADATRRRLLQRFPSFLDRQMRELIRVICRGVERDSRMLQRFGREITAAGVTHFLPNLECLAPFVNGARSSIPYRLKTLITFQGYELYAASAREIGEEATLYRCLREMVASSDWPAIAVSDAYADRICDEVGIERCDLKVIPAGVPVETPLDRNQATSLIRESFPEYQEQLPLVTYVGRRDSEKGIDLLLYAAQILKSRGAELQLAICGPSAFGNQYVQACRQIAWNMRLPVIWSDFVSDDLRSALFRASRAVIYPSIHGEPFGMAPVEAMAQGTPIIVPDQGGVAGVISAHNLTGGLQFQCWDSGDLARQLERLLHDAKLHQELSQNAPLVADHFSVTRMGDRILDHLALPRGIDLPLVTSPMVATSRSEAA